MAPIANDLYSSYVLAGGQHKFVEIAPKVIGLLEETKKESEFFDRTTCVYSDLLTFYGVSLGILGNFRAGETWIEKGLKHAHQIGHIYSIGWVESGYGTFFCFKGDAKNSIEHTQNSISCFEKANADAYLGMSWVQLRYGYHLSGDLDTALSYVQKGYKIQNGLGIPTLMSYFFWLFGVIQFTADELKDAQKSLERALSLSQENSEKLSEGISGAWLGRTLGKMDSSQRDKAEEYIWKGIEILKDLKIKPYHSQGYLFLGELYNDSDQHEKALEYLKKAEENFLEMEMDYWLDKTRAVLERL
jgi:tetratricopeptide (TPR) repeat protein